MNVHVYRQDKFMYMKRQSSNEITLYNINIYFEFISPVIHALHMCASSNVLEVLFSKSVSFLSVYKYTLYIHNIVNVDNIVNVECNAIIPSLQFFLNNSIQRPSSLSNQTKTTIHWLGRINMETLLTELFT